MTRPQFLLVLACAAALGGLLASATVPALAGNDVKEMEALKAKRDKYRKGLKEKGKMPFFDLSHAADPAKVQETRWTQSDPPPYQGVEEEKGVQFHAVWSPDITKGSPITVMIQKFIHKSPDGKSVYSLPFDHAGMKPECSDDDAMLDGFFLDTKRKMKEVKDEKCQKPKKTNVGPADGFASVVGLDPDSNKRERLDFYKWKTTNVTWIAKVTYEEKVMDDKDIIIKGEEFMKTITKLKPPE
jgi:hypothetical protein